MTRLQATVHRPQLGTIATSQNDNERQIHTHKRSDSWLPYNICRQEMGTVI